MAHPIRTRILLPLLLSLPMAAEAQSQSRTITGIPAYVLIRPDGSYARIDESHKSPTRLLQLLREARARE